MNMILCGYKSCGKTTIGRALSERLGCDFLDTDELVLAGSGSADIKSLVLKQGQKKFRDIESVIIQKIRTNSSVIALGGGVLLHQESATYLTQLGKIIYLYLPDDKIKQRILSQAALPSFIDPDNPDYSIQAYIESRRGLYERYSEEVLDVGGQSIDQCVNRLEEYYGK